MLEVAGGILLAIILIPVLILLVANIGRLFPLLAVVAVVWWLVAHL